MLRKKKVEYDLNLIPITKPKYVIDLNYVVIGFFVVCSLVLTFVLGLKYNLLHEPLSRADTLNSEKSFINMSNKQSNLYLTAQEKEFITKDVINKVLSDDNSKQRNNQTKKLTGLNDYLQEINPEDDSNLNESEEDLGDEQEIDEQESYVDNSTDIQVQTVAKTINQHEQITQAKNKNRIKTHDVVFKKSFGPSKKTLSELKFNDDVVFTKSVNNQNDVLNRAIADADVDSLNEAVLVLKNLQPSTDSKIFAYEKLIQIYSKNNNQQKLKAIIERALSSYSDYIPFILTKANMLIKQNKPQQAITLLRQNSPSIKEYPDYYALKAIAYSELNKFENAIDIYAWLTNHNPNTGDYWFGLAHNLEQLGKHNVAKDIYIQGIQTNTMSPALFEYAKLRVQEDYG